ncbi:MAG: trypsin-like serine protease [Pseudobacteriovorax sp.]|nr:trypsin-like serine protease [Pseudobacteriovorax sp.]
MIKLLRYTGFACIIVSTMSCRSTRDPYSAPKIAKGDFVSREDPVARSTVSIMDKTTSPGEFCTGTLITKFHVLTAAHCFNDRSRKPSVLFSNFYIEGSGPPPTIEVVWTAIHSQYNESQSAEYDKLIATMTKASEIPNPGRKYYDVAVLKLAEPAPSNYYPVNFLESMDILRHSRIVTAGFGCTSNACTAPRNILFKINMKLEKLFEESGLVVLSASGGQGSCPGDSGGPDYVMTPGGLEQFGIISTGPSDCEGGLTVDTLVSTYRSWIDMVMTQGAQAQNDPSVTFLFPANQISP